MQEKNYNRKGRFYTAESANAEDVIPCGFIQGKRFSACYRSGSCWMKTAFIDTIENLPAETQYLLAETETGYTLYFALCDGTARASLFSENGKAYCRVETGDKNLPLGSFRYVYALDCENPYDGMKCAYEELQSALGTFILKKDKKSPAFIDYFGFCTYNAFYSDITHDKILSVEELFRNNGQKLGFLIADEGWFTAKDGKLAAFNADEKKFPYGLKKTIDTCKEEYDLKYFLCWHTYNGYWKGIDAESFPQYAVVEECFNIPDRLKTPENSGGFAATAGEDFYPMNIAYQDAGICYQNISGAYMDFYNALKEQGVDGTKIDAMTWVEAFAEGKGGRTKAMNALLRAVENASWTAMNGNLINCSSCSNDFFMNLGEGSLTRTSCDYMPDKPLTHNAHVVDNAFVGFWVDPIVIADWDMFQSAGEWGAFHATARAISGGPVYCTDELEKANFQLLKKLTLPDGRVKRCVRNAFPTKACLFGTPKGEPFRIYNETDKAYILGAFGNAETGKETQIPLNEVEGLPVGNYAVYSSKQGFVGVKTEKDSVPCALTQLEAEVFTIVKIENGKAVIGDIDKLNPSAYIGEKGKVAVYTDEKGFEIVAE